VEAGIAEARARMQRESGAAGAADANGCPVATAPAAGSGCPVHRDPATSTNAIVTGSTARQGPGLNEITAPVVDDLGRRMTAQLPDG
jgi:hypothetical protein